MSDTKEEILRLNQRLLESIANADWATYQELCDPSLTAFEPEALGQLVEGLEFHRFYFNLGSATRSHSTTMCSPQVRMLGDVAIIAYVRLLPPVDRIVPLPRPPAADDCETYTFYLVKSDQPGCR